MVIAEEEDSSYITPLTIVGTALEGKAEGGENALQAIMWPKPRGWIIECKGFTRLLVAFF